MLAGALGDVGGAVAYLQRAHEEHAIRTHRCQCAQDIILVRPVRWAIPAAPIQVVIGVDHQEGLIRQAIFLSVALKVVEEGVLELCLVELQQSLGFVVCIDELGHDIDAQRRLAFGEHRSLDDKPSAAAADVKQAGELLGVKARDDLPAQLHLAGREHLVVGNLKGVAAPVADRFVDVVDGRVRGGDAECPAPAEETEPVNKRHTVPAELQPFLSGSGGQRHSLASATLLVHLSAIIAEKLYHLKKVSNFVNPASRSSCLFSSRR